MFTAGVAYWLGTGSPVRSTEFDSPRPLHKCGQVNRCHAGLISHASGVQLASPQPKSVLHFKFERRTRYELKDIRKIENLHVALWLLKDLSWCSLWRTLGMVMVIPTLVVAIWITWHSRKVLADCVHNGAVCFWICANITWMIGEFFFNDHSRGIARMFFFGGMALLIGYYLYEAFE